MARYGSHKFGTGKYGADAASDTLSWGLEIDWDGDGIFDGSNDAGRMFYLATDRGLDNYITEQQDGFEMVKPGKMTAKVVDLEDRYNPYNLDSPLYPNVKPGRKFRLRVMDNNTGIKYAVMTGKLTDIRPDLGDVSRVVITGVCPLQMLQDNPVTVEIQESIGIDDAVDMVLDEVGWEDPKDLDSTTEILPYWWARGNKATTELKELSNAALATFFIANDGTAKLYSRFHAVIISITLTGADVIKNDIEVMQPWDVVYNKIKVIAHPRTLQATDDLWQLEDVPYVAAGDNLPIWADYANGDPAKNVITPVANTDYKMNSQSDGLGVDQTGDWTVAISKFSTSSKLIFTNGGGSGGYITLAKLRGDAITASNPSTFEDSEPSDDDRTFVLDTPWLQSSNDAYAFCLFLLTILRSPYSYPKVKLRHNAAKQFGVDLFDIASMSIPDKYISGDYRLAHIHHEWVDKVGNLVETQFKFARNISFGGNYWVFPVTFGTNTVFPL